MALRIISNASGGGRGGSRGGSFKSGRTASKGSSFKAPAKAKPKLNVPAAKKALWQNSTGTPRNTSNSSTQSSSRNSGSPYTSTSYNGGGSPGGFAPPAPAAPTEQDYLAGDSTYQATIAALKKQLQNFAADIASQRSNRKLDYDKSLKDLGYVAPDPNARGAGPQWNWNDTLTASGRANQNQLNDFAARGMLQSSGYADSLQDLTRSLTDQYTGIDQANTQFNTDLDRQTARAKDENTSASQAARAEAIMRRAAQYGFGV